MKNKPITSILIISLLLVGCSNNQLVIEESKEINVVGNAISIAVNSCEKFGDAKNLPSTPGKLVYSVGSNEYGPYVDTCWKGKLLEYKCLENNVVQRDIIECQFGCDNGFCQEEIMGPKISECPGTSCLDLEGTTIVDAILTSCPSKNEITLFNNDFEIMVDEILPKYKCENGINPLFSDDKRDPRLTIYQILRVMKTMEFSETLPWTKLSLYDWFSDNIIGINIDSEAENSWCCSPAHVIHLKTSGLSKKENIEWVNKQSGVGLQRLIGLAIHEARHTTHPHSCGNKDNTLEEMGAWAVQYHLMKLIGENLPEKFQSEYEKNAALYLSKDILKTRFCNPDPSCMNQIQDNEELGVDCGGICPIECPSLLPISS